MVNCGGEKVRREIRWTHGVRHRWAGLLKTPVALDSAARSPFNLPGCCATTATQFAAVPNPCRCRPLRWTLCCCSTRKCWRWRCLACPTKSLARCDTCQHLPGVLCCCLGGSGIRGRLQCGAAVTARLVRRRRVEGGWLTSPSLLAMHACPKPGTTPARLLNCPHPIPAAPSGRGSGGCVQAWVRHGGCLSRCRCQGRG